MELLRLDPDDIEIGAARRTTDPGKVAALAASMKEIGLQTPISVWVTDDNQWVHLVAGRHRLEAAKRLGWDRIDCIVVALDERKRRMWEISENLHRAELTPRRLRSRNRGGKSPPPLQSRRSRPLLGRSA